MTNKLAWKEIRNGAFREWVQKQGTSGITRETYLEIIDFVLSKQAASGSFPSEGNHWEIVQTSVVLKALARLQFRQDDAWTNGNVSGGVKPAFDFLYGKLKDGMASVGEDIWDTCQALLAIGAYSLNNPTCTARVDQILENWESTYKSACEVNENRWRGAAYLAAMIDAVECYKSDLPFDSRVGDMLAKLVSLEVKGSPGSFACISNEDNIRRWNTALVLRTLANLKSEHQPIDLIERTASWLVRELNSRGWSSIPHEHPMYRARALEGLRAALKVVGPPLLDQTSKKHCMLMS